MYRVKKASKTSINVNTAYVGETIEQKVERIVNNKEPITDGAPRIFTERKDGVLPEFDIRTDRMEVALEAMDKVTKSAIAKRENRLKIAKGEEVKKDDKDGGAEPTQTTESK